MKAALVMVAGCALLASACVVVPARAPSLGPAELDLAPCEAFIRSFHPVAAKAAPR